MGKQLREFQIKDIIDFGKYKGQTIEQVYQFDLSYLDWCLKNVEHFYIDIDVFKDIPISESPKHEKQNEFHNGNDIFTLEELMKIGKTVKRTKFSEDAKTKALEKKHRLYHSDELEVDDEPHRPSYSKYGGYNGHSDEIIDIVFDGDPDATWNID